MNSIAILLIYYLQNQRREKPESKGSIKETKIDDKVMENFLIRIDDLVERKFQDFSKRLDDRLASFENHLIEKLSQTRNKSTEINA